MMVSDGLTDRDFLGNVFLDEQEWLNKAGDLMLASSGFDDLVDKYWQLPSKERKPLSPYVQAQLMLMGYALENLLKAAVVVKCQTALKAEFEEDGMVPSLLRTHDLVKLFESAGFRTTGPRTIGLLKRLTRLIVWEGKYPIPLRPSEFRKDDTLQVGQDFITLSAFYDTDRVDARTVFNGLKESLPTASETLGE